MDISLVSNDHEQEVSRCEARGWSTEAHVIIRPRHDTLLDQINNQLTWTSLCVRHEGVIESILMYLVSLDRTVTQKSYIS